MDPYLDSMAIIGQTVRIVRNDANYFDRLQRYNQLPWTSRMEMLIGKVGIVQSLSESAIHVTVYTWAAGDECDALTGFHEGCIFTSHRNMIVPITWPWHPAAVAPLVKMHFVDGDRAVFLKDRNLSHATVVSIRHTEVDGLYSLHQSNGIAFLWHESDNPEDTLLPIYTGQNMAGVLHDRLMPLCCSPAERTAERILFGELCEPPNPTVIFDAVQIWADTDNEDPLSVALYRWPQLKDVVMDGRTPLTLCVELGLWNAAVVLISSGADATAVDVNGNTLFHIAAARGSEQFIEGLLLFCVDEVNRQNFKGETALHLAARGGHAACLERLLNEASIDPNRQDVEGNTALHLVAVMEDAPSRAVMLHCLISNVNINHMLANNNGFIPLHAAIVAGQANFRVVEAMIEACPALLTAKDFEILPLHLAASYARYAVLDVILKHSADTSKVTVAKRTALHFAVERWDTTADSDLQRLACIQSLVSMGVPLNVRDYDGATALHLAVQSSHKEVHLSSAKMETLNRIKKPNIRLEEIATVIRPHWALAVVCFLVAQGCHPQLPNRKGLTALDLITSPSTRAVVEQFATCMPRACVPMSSTVEKEFDSSGVTMCTFSCDDNAADVMFVPCGHRVVCRVCASCTPLRRCPLCYTLIKSAKNSEGEEVKIGEKYALFKGLRDRREMQQDEAAKPLETGEMIDGMSIRKKLYEAVEEARRVAKNEKREKVRELQERLEQLESELNCAICMDKRSTIVFQCGHTACVDCGAVGKLKVCHICRQPILKRTTMFT